MKQFMEKIRNFFRGKQIYSLILMIISEISNARISKNKRHIIFKVDKYDIRTNEWQNTLNELILKVNDINKSYGLSIRVWFIHYASNYHDTKHVAMMRNSEDVNLMSDFYKMVDFRTDYNIHFDFEKKFLRIKWKDKYLNDNGTYLYYKPAIPKFVFPDGCADILDIFLLITDKCILYNNHLLESFSGFKSNSTYYYFRHGLVKPSKMAKYIMGD